MTTIKATWKNGKIVPDDPIPWPDGSKLVIREDIVGEIEFMTEESQGDEPESIQRWIEELRAIPPLPMTPEQEAQLHAWRQQVKEYNLAAVRRQMEEGIP